jgi:HAT1-interacting factor 1
MGGVLGTALGESPADAAARVEEAKKTATDLTGLVRRKAKPEPTPGPAATDITGLVRKKVKSEATPEPAASTNGKRKADDDTENSDAKKAKV